MQRHNMGTRSTRRLATGMAATLAVASLALATIVTAEHVRMALGGNVECETSGRCVACPNGHRSDRQTMATGTTGSGPGATHCTSRTSASPD